MSLPLACLPGMVPTPSSGMAPDTSSASPDHANSAWQKEMERALTQAWFPPPFTLREPLAYEFNAHGLTSPEASTQESSVQEPAMREANPARQQRGGSVPAPAIRVHAEWAAHGARLWLGAHNDVLTAQLTQQMTLWLSEHGVRLLSLVGNGKTLYAAAPTSHSNADERCAHASDAPRTRDAFLHYFQSKETT